MWVNDAFHNPLMLPEMLLLLSSAADHTPPLRSILTGTQGCTLVQQSSLDQLMLHW